MIRSLCSLMIAATAAASGPLAPAAALQEPSGASGQIEGTIFDSTRSLPLGGARVVLWNTPHQGLSDAEGRFRISGIPPGEYSVSFFHPRLTELGLASGVRPLRIHADDHRAIELAVPSLLTLAQLSCAGMPGVIAAGSVSDHASNLSLRGATVTFQWADSTGEKASRSTRADQHGWYQACGLPADRTLSVSASFLDRTARHEEITASSGTAVRLDLPLDELEPSVLRVRVRQAEDSLPLAGATVTLGLPGVGRRHSTDRSGTAMFEDVPPGRHSLSVNHLAFGSRRESIDVPERTRVSVAVDVAVRPIPVSPITVTVEQIEDVAMRMGGTHVTRAMIEDVLPRSRTLADVLKNQRISGLSVRWDAGGGLPCVEFNTGRVRLFKQACQPVMVVLDGIRTGDPQTLFLLPADVIDHMQLFRPVEAGNLFGPGAASGVLVVRTRMHH